MSKFKKGDRVFGPIKNRLLPICEIEEVYYTSETDPPSDPNPVYSIRISPNVRELVREESLHPVTDRFVNFNCQIWDTDHPEHAILGLTSLSSEIDEAILNRVTTLLNKYGLERS